MVTLLMESYQATQKISKINKRLHHTNSPHPLVKFSAHLGVRGIMALQVTQPKFAEKASKGEKII